MQEIPCKELWAAVLTQALKDTKECLKVHRKNDQPSQEEVKEWFKSESNEIGSFLWICELFELDPNLIRTHITDQTSPAFIPHPKIHCHI